MKRIKNIWPNFMLLAALAVAVSSCEVEDTPPKEEPTTPTTPTQPTDPTTPTTPFTQIPAEFVGTWYAELNQGPLTVDWEEGTFQGEQGFKEYRTMVFTQDGKNAVEYTTDIVNVGDEVKKYFYEMKGTLEYKTNPASITFHAQSGKRRVFSNKYTGYKEAPIVASDVAAYKTVLLNPEASTFSSSTNYLNAKRLDGGMQITVKYIKVDGNTTPGGGTPNPSDPYSVPPTTGSYVQIGNQYYPTVTIGDLEWMSANYAGTGGLKDYEKPQYGTFYKYMDLGDIQIPSGWRIPSKEDYLALLESQGIEFDPIWGSTDGEDLQSKKRLGQLMAAKGWLKQDGFANNKSGFNAVPGNLQVINGNPHGEGTNCLLWTSDLDEDENPVVFQIIQLPSDTYASFRSYIPGYNPPHIPVRLVRDK